MVSVPIGSAIAAAVQLEEYRRLEARRLRRR